MRHIPHQSHPHRRARHYGTGLCHGGRQPLPCSRRALSLIEIIVVIAVIGILVGLLYTGYRGVMGVVDKTRCATNLRQIGQHIHLYAADNNGDLVPTLYITRENTTSGTAWFQIMHQAGVFEEGFRRSQNLVNPSWHLNPKGMFTCPSPVGRNAARLDTQRKYNLTDEESYSAYYAYDGSHYGMFRTIAGMDNRINTTLPLTSRLRKPHKIVEYPNPSDTAIVSESAYRYIIYPNNTLQRATPHGGSFYLNLDGSVAFWEGELPVYPTNSVTAPPFWSQRVN